MSIDLEDGIKVSPAPTPATDHWGRSDAVAIAILLIATIIMIAALTYLGPILKPFLIAVFLFFATRGVAAFLVRLHVPAKLVYLVLFVFGATIITVLALLAYSEAWALQTELPRYQRRVTRLLDRAPLSESRPLAELFTESSRAAFRYCFEAGVGLLELLIMVFFYLLFLLLGSTRLVRRVQRAFPGSRGERILEIAGKIGTSIERFLMVKTQVSLGLAISASAVMAMFGLDGWLLWGLIFFAFNYITYVGSMLACVPPIAIAFLDFESPWTAGILTGLLIFNRFIWIDYVEIKLSGRHLNIDSVLLFLWLAYWGWAWGVIGLVLGFPMLTSLKITMEHFEATRNWAVIMSEE
jgi:AI-2 transport protein TqsA